MRRHSIVGRYRCLDIGFLFEKRGARNVAPPLGIMGYSLTVSASFRARHPPVVGDLAVDEFPLHALLLLIVDEAEQRTLLVAVQRVDRVVTTLFRVLIRLGTQRIVDS